MLRHRHNQRDLGGDGFFDGTPGPESRDKDGAGMWFKMLGSLKGQYDAVIWPLENALWKGRETHLRHIVVNWKTKMFGPAFAGCDTTHDLGAICYGVLCVARCLLWVNPCRLRLGLTTPTYCSSCEALVYDSRVLVNGQVSYGICSRICRGIRPFRC